ncbi:hypothetical protein AVEN_270315-1 [Araneus ventricosus]|uniref:Uncharacterized protein n=1 Tax=Araneus ventricosus TaxID=182803 RepID=A0A4Y2PH47_ARAVE|nr:hypothetical protein AVEN_270315-1 [Araneus ventricosus]
MRSGALCLPFRGAFWPYFTDDRESHRAFPSYFRDRDICRMDWPAIRRPQPRAMSGTLWEGNGTATPPVREPSRNENGNEGPIPQEMINCLFYPVKSRCKAIYL